MWHSPVLLAQTAPRVGTRAQQAADQPPAKQGPHWQNLIYIGLLIAGLVIAILIVRWALRISRWVFLGVLFVAGGMWTAYTLYHRTEPKFLTPVFDVLAEWLPTKDYMKVDPADAAAPKKK